MHGGNRDVGLFYDGGDFCLGSIRRTQRNGHRRQSGLAAERQLFWQVDLESGHAQCRLPTKDELVRRQRNRQGFNNVQASYYWSSSTYAGDTTNAWFVYLVYGFVDVDGKGVNNFVWPVRGGQ